MKKIKRIADGIKWKLYEQQKQEYIFPLFLIENWEEIWLILSMVFNYLHSILCGG
jgi:hypothetical protein